MSSLGAIAYHVFAGHPPADNPLDLPTLLREGNGLRLSSAVNGVGAWLEELVRAATAPVVRPRDAREFVDYLAEAEKEALPPEQAPPPLADPATAVSGDRLDGGLTVVQRLGRGDSADALLVRRDDSDEELVLKVAIDAAYGDRIRAEAEVLRRLHHQNIVRFLGEATLAERPAILMERAGEKTLAQWIRGRDTLSLDLMRRFGENLLAAVGHLEQEGRTATSSRTTSVSPKPPAREPIASCCSISRSAVRLWRISRPGLVLISIPSSPIVNRRLWDLNAERYAAAVTLHQLLDVPRLKFRYPTGDKVRREIRERAKRLALLRPDLVPGGTTEDDGRRATVDRLAEQLIARRPAGDERPEDRILARPRHRTGKGAGVA